MNAASLREQALFAARQGDQARTRRLFDQAVAAAPGDAGLWNSYGNILANFGLSSSALDCFDRALTLVPYHPEALINRAITLGRVGRGEEALDDLRAGEGLLGQLPRYWSARAGLEAGLGKRAAASASYDACLTLDPGHARAAHGRARMALERSEPDAVARYDRALHVTPGDAHLWLGRALALEAAGELAAARTSLEAVTRQLPQWTDANEALARLRWRAGDDEAFCSHYRTAAAASEADPALFLSWAAILAGVDRHGEAANVAAAGCARYPGHHQLALMEAAQAGMAGDDLRAEFLLAGTAAAAGAAALPHLARQAFRGGDPQRAEALLSEYLSGAPEDVEAWALRDLCWRVLANDCHHWLHGRDGLVRQLPLELDGSTLAEVIAVLRLAHARAPVPVGQSVRAGTQLNGGLFDRVEPAITSLSDAVADVVTRYQAGLPPMDPTHPLLRHRDQRLGIVGSWSVQFTGGGRHVEHIHPQGVLSSALHLVVPPDDCTQAGWLELGRAPADLRIDLPPLATFAPRPGTCVLFPSTLFHGTRPVVAGERLTAAFDIAPF